MSTPRLALPQLCLVTDPCIPDLVQRVKTALEAGITMLQLRGHQLPVAQHYEQALALRPLCRRYDVICIVNSRIDISRAIHADGVQLGAHSEPLAAARDLVDKDSLLGVSVHSLQEAKTAVDDGADFLLAGTIFASRTHPGGPVAGPQLLSDIKRAYPHCPLLAIGGITAQNAPQVMAAGADGIAVISAILGAPDIRQSIQELRHAIGLT